MTEPEMLFPVKCPVCLQESLSGFRISVVAEALETLEIRLYANCHVASWDASEVELAQMRQYLDAMWSENLREGCEDLPLDCFQQDEGRAFIFAGELDVILSEDYLCESSPS